MAGPPAPRSFFPVTVRDILLAIAWIAVILAVYIPFVKEWNGWEWMRRTIGGLLLAPFAIALVMLYRGRRSDRPDPPELPKP